MEYQQAFLTKVNNYLVKVAYNPRYLKEKIDEFLTFHQYTDALDYLKDISSRSRFSTTLLNNLEAKIYAQMAGSYYQEKNMAEAKKNVDMALSKNRADIDAVYVNKLLNIYYKWGYIENYILEDNYKASIAMANDVLKELPASIDVRMILIRALALDENRQSIEIMKRIKTMNVYSYLRLSLIADIYYGFGMYDYCESLYAQSLKENFNLHTAVMYTHTLGKLNKNTDALKLALDITIRYPSHSYAYYLASEFYLKMNSTKAAFELIGSAITIRNNIKYQLQLALCYRATNLDDEALEIYNYILTRNKYYVKAYEGIIEIANKNNTNLEMAKNIGEELIAIDDKNPYYYYLIANTYFKLGSNRQTDLKERETSLNVASIFYQNALNKTTFGRYDRLRNVIKNEINILNSYRNNLSHF